jgi:hypothetical protein
VRAARSSLSRVTTKKAYGHKCLFSVIGKQKWRREEMCETIENKDRFGPVNADDLVLPHKKGVRAAR